MGQLHSINDQRISAPFLRRKTLRSSFHRFRGKSEEGFTLAEALTSVAIIALLSASVWLGALYGMRALGKVVTEAEKNAEYLILDQTLRTAASRVVIPFWERSGGKTVMEEDTLGNADSASVPGIPWYGGRKDSVLRIGRKGKNVFVSSSQGEILIPVGNAKLEISLYNHRGTAGILSTVTDRLGDVLRIFAPFGGIPIGRESDSDNVFSGAGENLSGYTERSFSIAPVE